MIPYKRTKQKHYVQNIIKQLFPSFKLGNYISLTNTACVLKTQCHRYIHLRLVISKRILINSFKTNLFVSCSLQIHSKAKHISGISGHDLVHLQRTSAVDRAQTYYLEASTVKPQTTRGQGTGKICSPQRSFVV